MLNEEIFISFLIETNVFFLNLRILPRVRKNMHSARHRRQSNQKRMMNNKKKNLFHKIPLRTPPTRRASQRLGFNGGGNKIEWQFFFFAQRQKRSGSAGHRRTDGGKAREREREEGRLGELRKDTHGGVLYPLVGGLRFKATSPYPPQLPLCERVHERKRGWGTKREEKMNGWGRYMRVAARYFYWPRLSEGSRYKKKRGKKSEGRETSGSVKRGGNERERENGGSAEWVNPVIFFPPWFTRVDEHRKNGPSLPRPTRRGLPKPRESFGLNAEIPTG